MATVNLGSIKFKWKGTYNGGSSYTIDDVVEYNGSSYICKLASTGNLPTNTTYFDVMSAKGADGTNGTNGTNGTDVGTVITTQGDLLYRDGAGLQRLGAGTSGQFLKTLGTGANPTWDNLASNVDIVSYVTLDSTGVNTISITTDWSTNNYWKMEMFMQYGMSSSTTSKMRLRDASGDISSDTYQFLHYFTYDNETHTDPNHGGSKDLNGARTETEINGWGYNSIEKNPFFHLNIYKPDNNNRQSYIYDYYNSDSYNPNYHAWYRWLVWNNSEDEKKGWSLYGNSGANFINGFYIIYGYKYQ